jgi:penicillin-binding protein 1A
LIRFITSFFGGLFSWVVTALFFGALVVGAVFWVYSRDLPDYEVAGQLHAKDHQPHLFRRRQADGRIRHRTAHLCADRGNARLVKWAFISAEDKNFYTHKGFDARGMAAAFEAVKSRGKNVRGASTIPQQVAKNFLLSGDRTPSARSRNLSCRRGWCRRCPRTRSLNSTSTRSTLVSSPSVSPRPRRPISTRR